MNLGRRSAARGMLSGHSPTGRPAAIAGPFRRAVRGAATPLALLAAAGAADVAPAQLVPDGPNRPGAVESAPGGGFFGLMADGPQAAPGTDPAPRYAPQRDYASQQGYAPQPGYAPQQGYAPGQPTAPATAPQQAALLRRQQAYRQQAAAAQYAARQRAAQQHAAQPAPVTRVNHDEQVAAPARISVLGAVMQPRTYEFAHAAPDVAALLERAGGLTGKASGTVRVIRDGRQAGAVRYAPGMRLPLAAGDVVLCDAAPGVGPRERRMVYVAMVGLTDRPVVLKLDEADANLPAVLDSLKLPPRSIAAVGVLPPAGAAAPAPGGPLPDGAVLVFGAGSVTPAQWRDFRDVAFGDLVVEEEPEPLSLADGLGSGFEPVPPRFEAEPAAGPSQVGADAAFRISPRRPAGGRGADVRGSGAPAGAGSGSVVTPPLTLPSGDPVTSLPAPGADPRGYAPSTPPRSQAGSQAESVSPGAALGLAAPAGDAYGRGAGETVVDVTDLYDSGPSEVAMLPAPNESPYYGGEAYGGEAIPQAGPALADAGSHLMPLEDYRAVPGLSAPALPGPGGSSSESWRVAAGPTTPGRYSDAVPAGPRPVPTGSPAASPAPQPPTVPQPISGDAAKPIPAEPAAPATPAETNAESAAAESAAAESAAAESAGFPWLPAGLGLGALLGGLVATALVRRRNAALAAEPSADRAAAAPVAPAAEGATKAVEPPAASPARLKMLEDLLADRLPMEEEALRLPDSVALHGRSAGMTKLRVQAAGGGPGTPRFAETGAGAARRTEAYV